MDFPVARRAGQSLQIKFLITRDDCRTDSVAVAARHQGLEYLLRRQADLRGYGLRRQVVGINLVLPQFVTDTQLVEQTHCVGFLGHGFDCKGKAHPQPLKGPSKSNGVRHR